MDTARKINKLLDELSEHRMDSEEIEKSYKDPEFTMKNAKTGESVTKELVFNTIQQHKDKIIEQLNKITNNGQGVGEMFTNYYYVNNLTIDKPENN